MSLNRVPSPVLTWIRRMTKRDVENGREASPEHFAVLIGDVRCR